MTDIICFGDLLIDFVPIENGRDFAGLPGFKPAPGVADQTSNHATLAARAKRPFVPCGRTFLQSIASTLPSATFCPTGGINLANAETYLDLPNVICVGGSWVIPNEAVDAGRWDHNAGLTHEACRLSESGETS